VLHPARESLATLAHIRRTIGEYNFAGQYQQSPAGKGLDHLDDRGEERGAYGAGAAVDPTITFPS